jgi:hypothetical protein
MSAILQSAYGASAFTRTDPYEEIMWPSRSRHGENTSVFTCIDPNEKAQTQTWYVLIDELLRIRNLQDDWDGEGTEAPPPALVDGAIILAQCLQAKGYPPADRILAGVNGTIYFEWYTPLEYQEIEYQEIEVLSPMDAECRQVRRDSNVTEVIHLSRR